MAKKGFDIKIFDLNNFPHFIISNLSHIFLFKHSSKGFEAKDINFYEICKKCDTKLFTFRHVFKI